MKETTGRVAPLLLPVVLRLSALCLLLFLSLVVQGIPPDADRDNDVNGFFVAPSQPAGREEVTLVKLHNPLCCCELTFNKNK